MKILKVILENLNSLKGEFSIDFTAEAFAANGIFAITGPTGAGKSTLLDAICLALYSKTPRLAEVGGSNEIMSRGTGNCKARVFFEAGGQFYLASFEQHRARNQASGQLQKKTHKLLRATPDLQPSEEIESGKNVVNAVEKVTGLDFDKFTKSMLLSQGNFASFLKSDVNQRSELLEKLTGTVLYSQISGFVFEKTREAREKLTHLKEALSNITLLDEETVKAKEQQRESLHAATLKLQLSQNALNADLKLYTDLHAAVNKQTELEAKQQELENRRRAFLPSAALITMAGKARQISPLYSSLQEREREAKQVTEQITTLTAALEKQNTGLQKSALQADAAALALKEATQTQQAFKAIAPELFSLESKLASLTEQRSQRECELSESTAQTEAMDAELNRVTAALNKAQHALQESESFLETHLSDASLPEVLARHSAKLEALKDEYRACLKDGQDLEALTNTIAELAEQAENQKAQLNQKTQATAREARKLDGLKSRLDALTEGRDPETLEEESAHLATLLPRLGKLQDLSSQLAELAALHQKEEAELTGIEASLTALTAQKSGLSHAQELTSLKVTHQEELCEFKRKVMSLDKLRAELHDGKPCPLCGSTEHPLLKDADLTLTDSDEDLLKDLKTELAEINANLQELNLTEVRLMAELQHHQSSVKQCLSSQETLLTEKDSLKSTLLADSAFRALNLTPADLEESSLPSCVDGLFKRQAALTSLLKEYRKALKELQSLQSRLESDRESLNKQELILTALNTTLSEKTAAETKAREALAERSDALHSALTALSLELVHLEVTLPDTESPEDTLLSLEKAIESLRGRADTYLKQSKRRDTLREQVSSALSRHEILRHDLTLHREALHRLQEQAQAEEQRFNALHHQRFSLCAAPDLKDYQASLDTALNRATQRLNTLKEDQTRLEKALADLNGKLTSAREHASIAQSALEHAQNAFQERLRIDDLSEQDFITAIRVSDAELARLKALQEVLNTQSIELQSSLTATAATQRELTAMLQDKRPEEQLREELSANDTSIRAFSEERGALLNELRQHYANQQRAKEQLREIEAQDATYLRYERLNKLIGSADGKEYRKFVQGISLEYLIASANEQLRLLSDRYQLVKSADPRRPLDIEVRDLYQFSTRRPTSNLSGGETFIVSLALALGLSRMASDTVEVNSLFLDEGFGSLDDEALDSALNTLASLHREGKLIGVISHIDKVKERIITQIEVQRLSGGYSTLRGDGCTARL